MTSLNRYDVKTGTILEALEQKFSMHSKFPAKHPSQFFEFTLEELGLPSADELLKATLAIEQEVGLIGWRSHQGESETYKGFSLCYNPEDKVDPHATLGDERLTQTFSRSVNTGNFQDLRNTYHDGYAFTKLHPVVEKHYGPLMSRFALQPTRSRVSYIVPANDNIYGESTWHRDEFTFQNLRMNIPLQTEPAYVLEIKGSDEGGNKYERELHLEIGKAYVWNTRIPHRVYAKEKVQSDLPRIHIVLGFMPWFNVNNETGDFTPNEFFGIHPFDLIASKAFLK